MAENFYAILGVEETASNADIKKAYRKLAMTWHPDKNPSNVDVANEMFKAIAEAYDTLIDATKRSEYDYGINARQQPNQQYDNTSNDYRDGYRDDLYRNRRDDPFRSNFSNNQARDIFEHFFAASFPFQQAFDYQQPSNNNNNSNQHQNQRQQFDRSSNIMRQPSSEFGGFGSPFGGTFFGGDPFGDMMGNMSNMSSCTSSSYSGSRGSSGRSVSTFTTIDARGRAVTRTETTIRHSDGTSETTVEDSFQELRHQVMTGGGSRNNNNDNYNNNNERIG